MKSFVREMGSLIVAMTVVTLATTSLAGGSETAFYLASFASLAGGIWWAAWKGKLG
jgi:hypothetical protein